MESAIVFDKQDFNDRFDGKSQFYDEKSVNEDPSMNMFINHQVEKVHRASAITNKSGTLSIANESRIQNVPFSHLVKMVREDSNKSSQVEYRSEH